MQRSVVVAHSIGARTLLALSITSLWACATSSTVPAQRAAERQAAPRSSAAAPGDTRDDDARAKASDTAESRAPAPETSTLATSTAAAASATAAHDELLTASGSATHLGPTPMVSGSRAHLYAAYRYDIPVADRPEVERWVQYFGGAGAPRFSAWLERLAHYQPLMQPILREYDVPDDTIFLALIESGLSSRAYSHAHASGFWQFIEATGRAYGLRQDFWVDERRDPVRATRAAARHLRDLYHEFGDWPLAWAAYNAGAGKIRTAIRRYGSRDFFELTRHGYLRPETCDYVPKLMAAAIVAKNARHFGLNLATNIEPFAADPLVVDDATDLGLIARGCGAPMETLMALNPELRRWATPPHTRQRPRYTLRVPAGSGELCRRALESVPPSQRLTFRHHRVRSGEVLGRISARYGISLRALMQLNKIRDARRLRAGQDLIIPIPAHVPERVYRHSTVVQRPGDDGLRTKKHRNKKRQRLALATTTKAPAGAERVIHVVEPGDSLWSIGRRYAVPIRKLCRWNGIRKRQPLRLGQRLTIYVVRD